MIRLTFQHEHDPKWLHKRFLEAGVHPRLYSYRPRSDTWSMTMQEDREGIIVREVLDRLAIDFDEVVVPSRFVKMEAVE